MTTSQVTEHDGVVASNQSLLPNATSWPGGDECNGAGKYSDGTCRTVWPFWVEVTVPLCCVLFFLLTLTIVYLRPIGPSDKNDSCKQQLNIDDSERTEHDTQHVLHRQAGETSMVTKV